jgi:hypothetical protein
VVDVIAHNRSLLNSSEGLLLGRPWREVRKRARREILELSRRYLEFFSPNPGLPQGDEDAPLFVAGHQPELFHPGVWLKNFALAGLARRHNGVSVNLVVDNDTLKSSALRVPAAAKGSLPRAVLVPFDRWSPEAPWEERPILDKSLFASFSDRVMELMRPWGYEPLLPALWEEVRLQAEATGRIGESFTAARRSLERSWGCRNLEMPLGIVCGSESFSIFAGAILDDLPRFVESYNDVVRAYRARNRIRSRNHPVPDLARDGDWLEAPLWGWRTSQRRERLFARIHGDRLQLRAGQESWPDLPVPTASGFVAAWKGLASTGFKVRSRALTTTLFSRLLLADLFMHGIGGGKYDELTDDLIKRFFAFPPPPFLILSGTLRLPVTTFPATMDGRRRLAHHLRDLRCNPQRHLAGDRAGSLGDLIQEKQRLIAAQPVTLAGRRERRSWLRKINERLHAPLIDEDARLVEELARTDEQLRSNSVLRRRDYSFCLFPESVLKPFCTALL